MGNSLRCCLACALPCGALDVIRIVHLDGQVEEYSRQVSAGEILAANPNHIISKPCSQGVTHRILIVSPDCDLERGRIYFLIPSSSSVSEKNKNKNKKKEKEKEKEKKKAVKGLEQNSLLKEALSGKKSKSAHCRRRSNRVAMWHPHLESITEDP